MSEESRYPETSAPCSLPLYPSSRWMIILQINLVNGAYFISFGVFFSGMRAVELHDSESLTTQEYSLRALFHAPGAEINNAYLDALFSPMSHKLCTLFPNFLDAK